MNCIKNPDYCHPHSENQPRMNNHAIICHLSKNPKKSVDDEHKKKAEVKQNGVGDLHSFHFSLPVHPLLWYYSILGYEKKVQQLLISGCDVNITDGNTSTTPLMEASKRGHLSIVRALLQCVGIKLNLVDIFNKTALHMAVKRKHLDVCQLLIAAAVEHGYFSNLCGLLLNELILDAIIEDCKRGAMLCTKTQLFRDDKLVGNCYSTVFHKQHEKSAPDSALGAMFFSHFDRDTVKLPDIRMVGSGFDEEGKDLELKRFLIELGDKRSIVVPCDTEFKKKVDEIDYSMKCLPHAIQEVLQNISEQMKLFQQFLQHLDEMWKNSKMHNSSKENHKLFHSSTKLYGEFSKLAHMLEGSVLNRDSFLESTLFNDVFCDNSHEETSKKVKLDACKSELPTESMHSRHEEFIFGSGGSPDVERLSESIPRYAVEIVMGRDMLVDLLMRYEVLFRESLESGELYSSSSSSYVTRDAEDEIPESYLSSKRNDGNPTSQTIYKYNHSVTTDNVDKLEAFDVSRSKGGGYNYNSEQRLIKQICVEKEAILTFAINKEEKFSQCFREHDNTDIIFDVKAITYGNIDIGLISVQFYAVKVGSSSVRMYFKVYSSQDDEKSFFFHKQLYDDLRGFQGMTDK